MSKTSDLLNQLRETLKAELREEVRREIIAELSGKSRRLPKTGLPIVSTGRRTSEAVEQTGLKVLAWLRKNPASRVEQIAVGLNTDTRMLILPISKLLEAKKISRKGVKRGTTYTAKG